MEKGSKGYFLCGGRAFNTAEELRQKADEYFLEKQAKDEPFLMVGLCLFLGITYPTLHLYANGKYDTPENNFSEIIRACKMRVEEEKLAGALVGKYNPVIAKFDLSHNHDYAERTKITGDETQPVVNKLILDEKAVGAVVSTVLEKF